MLEVMRDILQSRYLRSNVAHKQLARTSLILNKHKVKHAQANVQFMGHQLTPGDSNQTLVGLR